MSPAFTSHCSVAHARSIFIKALASSCTYSSVTERNSTLLRSSNSLRLIVFPSNRLNLSYVCLRCVSVSLSFSFAIRHRSTTTAMPIMVVPVLLLVTILSIGQSHGHRNLLAPSAKNCTIRHAERTYHEGEKLLIEQRLHKVEDCQLQRGYQTCGTHLWFMVNIVCQAIDQQKKKTTKVKSYARRYVKQKLLSEACCEHVCTVSEMTRYCP